MLRFIITVLVGTVLHALACIIMPPFEFAPTRLACFFWALRSGIVVFPIMFAVLLLPLRVGLRHFMPQRTPQTHAVMAAFVLFVVVAVWILARQLSGVPSPPYEHGYLCQWIFWPLFVFAIAISFFWPFGTRATIQTDAGNDHAA
jgi:predicted tellurium resistance membrane protein TerC